MVFLGNGWLLSGVVLAEESSPEVVHGVQVEEHVALTSLSDIEHTAPAQQKLPMVCTLLLEHTGSVETHAEKARTEEETHQTKSSNVNIPACVD